MHAVGRALGRLARLHVPRYADTHDPAPSAVRTGGTGRPGPLSVRARYACLPGACRTDRVSWHHRLPAWHGGPHNSTNLRGRTRLQAAAAASPEEEEADEGEGEVVVLEDAIILEAQVVSTTAELGVRRLLNFRAGGRARAGGLEHVTMQFELTDGRSTGGTFLDPGPLLDDPVGRSMLHASMWMSSRPRREAATNSPSSTPCHSIRSSSGQPTALAGLDQPRTIAGVAWLAGAYAILLALSPLPPPCAPLAPPPPRAFPPAPGPHLALIVCPPSDRRAFGRERSALRRFLPAALTEAESDEVDISAPGFGAWPSAEPWAEEIAALEGDKLEEVKGAEVAGAESAPSSPDPSERIAVECTRCRKWRLVNKGEGAEEDDTWECALNNDVAYNTCQVAQEMSNAEMDAYLGLSQKKRGGGGGGSKRTPASERERLGLPAEVGFSMRATVDKRRIEHAGERYATIQERLPPAMRKAGWCVTPQIIWPNGPMPQCPMPQCTQ